MRKIKLLKCNCCGKYTHGRQWWNRDDGYGLCKACLEWQLSRGETLESIEFNNGKVSEYCGID